MTGTEMFLLVLVFAAFFIGWEEGEANAKKPTDITKTHFWSDGDGY